MNLFKLLWPTPKTAVKPPGFYFADGWVLQHQQSCVTVGGVMMTTDYLVLRMPRKSVDVLIPKRREHFCLHRDRLEN